MIEKMFKGLVLHTIIDKLVIATIVDIADIADKAQKFITPIGSKIVEYFKIGKRQINIFLKNFKLITNIIYEIK